MDKYIKYSQTGPKMVSPHPWLGKKNCHEAKHIERKHCLDYVHIVFFYCEIGPIMVPQRSPELINNRTFQK